MNKTCLSDGVNPQQEIAICSLNDKRNGTNAIAVAFKQRAFSVLLAFLFTFFSASVANAAFIGSGGTGADNDPYLISSVADLKELSTETFTNNSSGKYFKLTADIDMTGVTDFTPIGGWSSSSAYEFNGHFDGNGKKITNLTISTWATYIALFGYNKGTITNLGIEGGKMDGRNYVGGLVGENSGTVSNCYAAVTVEGSQYVGGLIGMNSGTVSNCYATGAVKGSNSSVGGLVGRNYLSSSTISNCYAAPVSLTGVATLKGVLIGNYIAGIITNCYYSTALGIAGNGGIDISAGGLTGKIVDDLKATTMIDLLNGSQSPAPWKLALQYNSGYPVLSSQYDFVVTYDGQGGTIMTLPKIGVKGTSITKPTDPTKTGHTFDGWFKEAACTNEWNFETDVVATDVTLYAKWTIITYTITFKSQDGSADLGTLPIPYGTNVRDAYRAAGNIEPTKPPIPLQYTYVFEGWNILQNRERADYEIVGESDMTVYAAFREVGESYTVIFTSQDGTTILETFSIPYGADTRIVYQDQVGRDPDKAPTPQYTYGFVGWSTEQNSETANYPTVIGDATVYAAFSETIRKYTVTFKSQDGNEVLGTSTVDYGTAAIYPKATPTKAATAEFTYTFAGWNTAINAEVADDDLTNVIADRTVFAAFSKTTNQYTVTFKSQDDNEVLGTSTVNYNTDATYPNGTPTKVATAEFTYTFEGWNTAANAEVANDDLKNVITNRTVYAAFSKTINTYIITFKSQDGNDALETSILTNYGTTLSSIYEGDEPIKPSTAEFDYTFVGWNTAIDAEVDNYLTVVGNQTVYAAFGKTTRQYTITFKSYEEFMGVVEADKQTVNYGTTVTYRGTTPTQSSTAQYDFTFVGWNTAIYQTVANASLTVVGDITVYAAFSETTRQYTVTFKSQDGITVLGTAEVNYGTAATYPNATPTKGATAEFSYTFKGWNISRYAETADADLSTITGYQTVYAAFSKTPRQYTVTFNVNGGTTVATKVDIMYSSTITAPDSPTKDGFTFAGWYKEAALTNAWNFTTNKVTTNITLYAKWTAVVNKFTVTFNSNGGSTVAAINNVTENSIITKPTTDPTKSNFKFDGWYKEAALTNAWNFTTNKVTTNITLYAKWTAVTGITKENLVLTLYPNPVVTVLNISNISQTDATTVEIFDITGRLVLQVPATEVVDVSVLSHGLYTVKAGKYTAKIMKN